MTTPNHSDRKSWQSKCSYYVGKSFSFFLPLCALLWAHCPLFIWAHPEGTVSSLLSPLWQWSGSSQSWDRECLLIDGTGRASSQETVTEGGNICPWRAPSWWRRHSPDNEETYMFTYIYKHTYVHTHMYMYIQHIYYMYMKYVYTHTYVQTCTCILYILHWILTY